MALGSSAVDGKAFSEFSAGRRSTRVFRPDPIAREVVERLIQTAIEAPTACNRQLWHFVIIDDPQVKVEVCRESDAQQSYLHDAPVLVALFYDTSLEPRNPCNTAQISMGMATYGLLLAAESEGIGAIYLGGIRNPRGCERCLGAPSYWNNYGFVCLGYRADDPPAPIPREASSVVSYNRFELEEKRFHMDIRPHLWSLKQLADFRDKLIWYKGIAIDGKTLHVDPDPRFSVKIQTLATRAAMRMQEWERPTVLDVMTCNGDLLQQLLAAAGKDQADWLAYDLSHGIEDFLYQRFSRVYPDLPYRFIRNSDPDRMALPLEDQSVDVFTCYERFDHFQDPEPLMRELRRVARTRAVMLACVSGRYYPHLYRYRRMRKKNYALGRNWNRGPERKFNPQDIERHFRNTGWKVEAVTGIQPVTLKFFEGAARVAARAGRTDWSDWFRTLRTDHFITRGSDKPFSATLLYELRAD